MAVVPRMLSQSTGKAFPSLSKQLHCRPSWRSLKVGAGEGWKGRLGRDVKEIVKKCPPAPVTHVRLSGCQDERQAWNRAETVP